MNNNKARLKSIVNKYRKLLGISSWSIEVKIVDNKTGLAKNKNFYFKDSNFWAEVSVVDLNKRHFEININEKALERSDLEKIILHELLHVLLWKTLSISESLGASHEINNEKIQKSIEKSLDEEEHFIIDKLLKVMFYYENNIHG